ncbi:MAG TPA: ATP-binding cassette domain-containing protein [Vicinamibacterales bacterium]|nr:ATP-binding cassette domain-containing protein [Vicinamibacterales bacterium]
MDAALNAPLVQLVDLTKRFNARAVIHGLSLEIQTGEAVAVVGPSGCGKTTLLRLIAGLDVPDRGEIRLAGRLVSTARRSVVPPYQRGIGFVFQDLALWPHLTIRESLEFVLQSQRVPKADWRDRVGRVISLVRIDRLADRRPHELSGGEQQRAALARALVSQPPLLLLDEPLSSLDPDLRVALRAELTGLTRALGVTMIHVTHDRDDAAALADRVVSLRDGRIAGDRAQRPAATSSDR